MRKVTTDECGRISLPRETREEYGGEFRLVELQNSLKLVPVPEDPLEALQSAASEEFESASTEELREAGRKHSRKTPDGSNE